jgi:cell wall-associated NlpC family hydrolase
MLKQLLFIVLIGCTIASCSSKKHISKQNPNKVIHKEAKGKVEIKEQKKQLRSESHSKTQNFKKKIGVKHKLETHYKKYKAIPYKYGGTSIKGFDCSGFVQYTYKNLFKLNLPRTTGLMLKEGKSVSKSKLRIGDLVLFRTSKRYRHVGIFMGENQFMHVSTKKGLIKSNLDNPDWLKHYLTSRRIF